MEKKNMQVVESKKITYDDISCVTRVVYHAYCGDGTGAAYCLWRKLGRKKHKNVKYIPLTHCDPSSNTSNGELKKLIEEELTGENVVFLDFCLSKTYMEQIYKVCNKLLIIDHHKSTLTHISEPPLTNHAIITMKNSAAVLAWKFCYPNEKVPLFLKLIEDRDIWKWEFKEQSEPFFLARHQDYNKDKTDSYEKIKGFAKFEDEKIVNEYIERGKLLIKERDEKVEKVMRTATSAKIAGKFNIKVCVCGDPSIISYLGNELAKMPKCDFAVIINFYPFITDEGIKISLRSLPTTMDVCEVAKLFNGGGHVCASGFTYEGGSHDQLIDQLSDRISKSDILMGRKGK